MYKFTARTVFIPNESFNTSKSLIVNSVTLGPLILTLFKALRSASLGVHGSFIILGGSRYDQMHGWIKVSIFSWWTCFIRHIYGTGWLCYLAWMGVIWQSGIGSWSGEVALRNGTTDPVGAPWHPLRNQTLAQETNLVPDQKVALRNETPWQGQYFKISRRTNVFFLKVLAVQPNNWKGVSRWQEMEIGCKTNVAASGDDWQKVENKSLRLLSPFAKVRKWTIHI